jgi:hypothetical protein
MDQQLKTAAKRGHVDQIRRLLEQEQSEQDAAAAAAHMVRAKDVHGCTALHLAIRYSSSSSTNNNGGGGVDVVALLLEKGALINDQDHKGWTPLHRACIHGRVAVACLLLEKGADPTIQDRNGKTPFDVAVNSCSSLSFIIQNTNALNHQVDILTNEKRTLEEQIETLSGEKVELLQDQELLLQEMETWKTRHEEMEETAFGWHEQNKLLRSQIHTWTTEKETLEEQVDLLSRATTDLLQESQTLTLETETWENRHDAMQQKSDLLEAHVDALTSEKQQLQEQIHLLLQENTELSAENETLTQENYTFINLHQAMSQKVESFQEKIILYQAQNESLVEQTVQLQTSLANLHQSHQKQDELQAEIRALHATVARQEQKEHARLQVEHDRVLLKLAQYEQRLEQPPEQLLQGAAKIMQRRPEKESLARLRHPALMIRRNDAASSSSSSSSVGSIPVTPEIKDPANADAGRDQHYHEQQQDQQLISVDSTLSDELVSILMVTDDHSRTTTIRMAHHPTAGVVGGQPDEDELWTAGMAD